MNNNTATRGFTVVVAGKGGTGKTLVSALLVRDQRRHGPVLAIDADPDSNLPEALGVASGPTVGELREKITEYKTRRTENRAETAHQHFERTIMEAVVESQDFDLLVMGRGEGEGCYCAVNHILRGIIDSQASRYPTVVIDSEAGLEHISRRTARDMDVLLLVTDPTARGMGTARRVSDLARQLKVSFDHLFVLVNKVTDSTRPLMEKAAAAGGLKLAGFLPFDPAVAENDARGKSVWELPADGPVLGAAAAIFAKLDKVREDKLARSISRG